MRVIAQGPGFIASGPDVIGQCITVDGKLVHFDFDEMFGPLVTDKRGEPLKRQPIAQSDPFWPPFNRWLAEYRATKRGPVPEPEVSARNASLAGSRTASQAPGKDALASDLNQEALLAALAKQEGRGE